VGVKRRGLPDSLGLEVLTDEVLEFLADYGALGLPRPGLADWSSMVTRPNWGRGSGGRCFLASFSWGARRVFSWEKGAAVNALGTVGLDVAIQWSPGRTGILKPLMRPSTGRGSAPWQRIFSQFWSCGRWRTKERHLRRQRRHAALSTCTWFAFVLEGDCIPSSRLARNSEGCISLTILSISRLRSRESWEEEGGSDSHFGSRIRPRGAVGELDSAIVADASAMSWAVEWANHDRVGFACR